MSGTSDLCPARTEKPHIRGKAGSMYMEDSIFLSDLFRLRGTEPAIMKKLAYIYILASAPSLGEGPATLKACLCRSCSRSVEGAARIWTQSLEFSTLHAGGPSTRSPLPLLSMEAEPAPPHIRACGGLLLVRGPQDSRLLRG